MKKKTLFATVGAGLSLALAAIAFAGVASNHQAKEVGAAPVTLTALTGTSDILSGTSYLIASNYNSTGTEYAPVLNGGTAGFAAGNVLTQLKSGVDSTTKLLNFTSTTNGYYLMDGAKYFYANNTNNGLATGTTQDVWTVAYVSGKGFTFKEATNSRYITLYQTSNFRSYTSVYDNGKTQNSYFNIYSVAAASVVNATSISLGTYSTTMTAGTNQSITATMLPANTTESVVWTSSDNTVLQVVDSAGTTGGVSTATVTPLNNGTATITATASSTSSVTVTTSTITVTGFSSSIAPITLTSTDLTLGSSYAGSSGDKTVGGAVYCVENAMNVSSDYSKSSSIVAYEKGGIQIQSATGFIYSKTKFAAQVNDILISGVASSTAITVSGGATAKAVTTVATKTVSGMIFKYAFATPVDYFTIAATSTGYMNSFTVEFVGGAETTASLAAYISGLIPDRADSTALCTGSTGNYVVAKTRFLAASAAVQSDFQSSSDTAVAAARTRYVHWCAVAGDNSPYSSTIVPQTASMVDGMTDGATIAILCTVFGLGVIALAGVMILRKKHN
jgi:hypothetical protein